MPNYCTNTTALKVQTGHPPVGKLNNEIYDNRIEGYERSVRYRFSFISFFTGVRTDSALLDSFFPSRTSNRFSCNIEKKIYLKLVPAAYYCTLHNTLFFNRPYVITIRLSPKVKYMCPSILCFRDMNLWMSHFRSEILIHLFKK